MFGPYLNALPIITLGLFIVQQKMFTPPPTNEQQELQQKMMMGMTVVMGVMFFKVASGLCLYFIASNLWSLAERTIVPRITGGNPLTPPPPPSDDKPSNKPPGLLARLQEAADNANKTAPPPKGKRQRDRK